MATHTEKELSTERQQLLSNGWRLDRRIWPIMIAMLGVSPLIGWILPAEEQAWQNLLTGLQAFGLGLFVAQFAPIWSKVEASSTKP